jgi:hypothetical protein
MQRLLLETALSAPPVKAKRKTFYTRRWFITKSIVGVLGGAAWLLRDHLPTLEPLRDPNEALTATTVAPVPTTAGSWMPMPQFPVPPAISIDGPTRQVHVKASNSAGSFDVVLDRTPQWFRFTFFDGPSDLAGSQVVVDPTQVFVMDAATLQWSRYGAPLPEVLRTQAPAKVEFWNQVVTLAALPHLEMRSTEEISGHPDRTGYHIRLDVGAWRTADPVGFDAWRATTEVFGAAPLVSPTDAELAPVYDLMLDVDATGAVWGWRVAGGGDSSVMEVLATVLESDALPIPATYTDR